MFLHDRNTLHCLRTPKGRKPLLAMYCDGRASPEVDYRVIDPATNRLTSASNAADECSAECAQAALGIRILETGLR